MPVRILLKVVQTIALEAAEIVVLIATYGCGGNISTLDYIENALTERIDGFWQGLLNLSDL